MIKNPYRVLPMSGNDLRISCYPIKGVVKTTPGERAIGRFSRVRAHHVPSGDAQIDLAADIFYSLLKNEPQFKENVPPGREINKMLVEWAMENPEFEKARWSTIGNLPVATISAGLLWELLVTDEALQEALKKQEEAEQLIQEAQEQYNQAAGEEDADQRQEALNQAKKNEKQAQELMKQASQKVDKLKNHPIGQGMMSSAMSKTAQEAQETAEVVKSWGLEAGSMTALDSENVLEMLRRNKDMIYQISKMVGRFKGIASSTIEKVKRSYVGPVSEPASTKDLLKLFPTERAYLSQYSPPYLRATKIVQLARSGLLGWQNKSEGKREGGIKVLVDGSGSMNGDQDIIAKSIALGLAKALAEEKRPYHLITFGSYHDEFIEINDQDDWQKHIDWATRSPGGGTDFEHAFRKAIEEVHKSHKVGKHGHDLLFITDGYADISSNTTKEWRETSAETGARLMYIDICGSENYEVKQMADMYVSVRSAHDLDKVADQLVTKITELVTRQR